MLLLMPKPLPDWARCINCKVNARNGAIVHLRGCPDYRTTVRPGATTIRLSDLLRK